MRSFLTCFLVLAFFLPTAAFSKVPFEHYRKLPEVGDLASFPAIELMQIYWYAGQKGKWHDLHYEVTLENIKKAETLTTEYFEISDKALPADEKAAFLEDKKKDLEKVLDTEVEHVVLELRLGVDYSALGLKPKGLGRIRTFNKKTLRDLIWLNTTGLVWSLTDR